MAFAITILSFIGLYWAANHLVIGAIGLANHYKMPPLIIGLTIVAIGTSVPQIMIGLSAALKGRNELALGNAIGTNIANIGLILGIILLLRPLTIRSLLLRREYPLLFLVMLFSYSLMLDGYLGVIDGCLFLLACIALILYFLLLARKATRDVAHREYRQLIQSNRSMKSSLFSLILGLCVLPFCAHFIVKNMIYWASILGVSDLIIGLTVVAIGASLPQVTTSMIAAYKGYDDIAVGNILGSNMYNLLIVLAFPSLINPAYFSHIILWRDIPVMFLMTGALVLFSYRYKQHIARWHGGLLLLMYCSYIVALIVNAIN